MDDDEQGLKDLLHVVVAYWANILTTIRVFL